MLTGRATWLFDTTGSVTVTPPRTETVDVTVNEATVNLGLGVMTSST
jgi:hypothetical protein